MRFWTTDWSYNDFFNRLGYSRKSAIRVGLLLDNRLGWLWGGYGVRVPMHYLPATILWSKDHRSPKRVWGDLLPFADLGLQVLYLHHVGELRSHVLGYDLKAGGPTVSAQRCGMLRSLGNLIPPTRGRALGVGEARVI
jgi:hypothetical protein